MTPRRARSRSSPAPGAASGRRSRGCSPSRARASSSPTSTRPLRCGTTRDDRGQRGRRRGRRHRRRRGRSDGRRPRSTASVASTARCNNAGIAPDAKPFVDHTLAEWQRTIDIDLTGVFLCMQHELRQLRSRRDGGGAIVNISSAAGVVAGARASRSTPRRSTACSGSRSRPRRSTRRSGIRVNAVLPGPDRDRADARVSRRAARSGREACCAACRWAAWRRPTRSRRPRVAVLRRRVLRERRLAPRRRRPHRPLIRRVQRNPRPHEVGEFCTRSVRRSRPSELSHGSITGADRGKHGAPSCRIRTYVRSVGWAGRGDRQARGERGAGRCAAPVRGWPNVSSANACAR